MPDVNVVIDALDSARRGYNDARNAAEEWRKGKVAGIDHTADQLAALKTAFLAGMQAGDNGVATVRTELTN